MSFNVNTFNSDNWHRDARSTAERDRIRTRRWGMRVTVYQGVNAGDYVLSYGLNSTNLQDNDNWLLVADIGETWGGGGAVITADNGLTKTGDNIQWGGPMLSNDDAFFQLPDATSYWDFYPGTASVGTAFIDFYMESALEFAELFMQHDDVLILQGGNSIEMTPASGIEIAANPGTVTITAESEMVLNSLTASIELTAIADINLNANDELTATVTNLLLMQGGGGIQLVTPALSGSGIMLDSDFDIDVISNTGSIANTAETGITFDTATGVINFTNNSTTLDITGTDIIATAADEMIFTATGTAAFESDGNVFITSYNNDLEVASGSGLLSLSGEDVFITTVGINPGQKITIDAGDEMEIRINGSNGNPGDVLTSDGTLTTWVAGATALTFENGVEEIAAGVVGLGSPLTQNTLIDGDSFDLQMGTFLTSPLGSFQMYSEGSIFLSTREPVGGLGASLGLGVDGGASFGVSSGPITSQNTVAQATTTQDLWRFIRNSSNAADAGVIASWNAKTSTTATSGFGFSFTYNIENGSGNDREAANDRYTFVTVTNNAEYATYRKQLKVAGSMTDVIDITTNSTAPNIFTTLFGQIIMPDLPTADPAIPGYLYMDGGTGALFVSL